MISKFVFSLIIMRSTAVLVDFAKNFDYDLMKPISVSEVSKKFGDTFEILLNYDGPNHREHSLNSFGYLYNGFYVLHNLSLEYSLPKFAEPHNSSFEKASFDLFFDALRDVKHSFQSQFIDIIGNYEGFHSTTITYFFNKTINNCDFQNSLNVLKLFTNIEITTEATKIGIHENIFKTYFERYKQSKPHFLQCDNRPLMRLLFNFYESVLTTVIEAYTLKIIIYEFEHLKTENYTTYKTEQLQYLSGYWNTIRNVEKTADEMISLLPSEYREFKDCDPEKWIEGKNYIRVKNYVSNSLDLVRITTDFETREEIGLEFECSQHTLRSNSFDFTTYSLSCPEIFETKVMRDDCKTRSEVKGIFSYPDHDNWPMKCVDIDEEHPISHDCSCDKLSDSELSLRTINLREKVTDTENKWVVTGLRFATENHMIGIQIQEGQIVNGTVDPGSVRWRTDEGDIPSDGRENATLSYIEKSFNMDDVEIPNGKFVTGVRFKMIENHVVLSVRGTEMWDKGRTWASSNHQWYEQKFNSKEERLKIDIQDFKNSAEIDTQNVEVSSSGRDYVDLTVGLYSNIYHNLAVIPFFDSRIVSTDPPAPISGVGIFYKNYPSFGGFIAIKFFDSPYSCNL